MKFGDHGLKTPLRGTLAYNCLQSGKLPGPGAYSPADPKGKINGGKWGKHSAMSYIDTCLLKTRGIPGPSAYGAPKPAPINGGKFSISQSKSDIEWQMYRAKQIPGPGQYGNPKAPQGGGGGRFSTANPKGETDWIVYRAKGIPAPGEYGAPSLPPPRGGRFSTSKPKSDVEWMIARAAQIPGPSQYGAPPLPKPSGGKFNMSKAKSSIDWEVYRCKDKPGPGAYSPERSMHVKHEKRLPRSISAPPEETEVPEPILASLHETLTQRLYHAQTGSTVEQATARAKDPGSMRTGRSTRRPF